MLELVICGRSVAITLCASEPHFCALACIENVPTRTQSKPRYVRRGMQRIIPIQSHQEDGAPGEIRTPDPLVRSLTVLFVFNYIICCRVFSISNDYAGATDRSELACPHSCPRMERRKDEVMGIPPTLMLFGSVWGKVARLWGVYS